jgi:Skp family chaperone for outer membrane proteins
MNEIIEKLTEIETTASRILDAAANQKKQLDEKQQGRIEEYDKELEASTAKELSSLQKSLSEKIDTDLAALAADSKEKLKSVDLYYEKNHGDLSTQIYKKLLRK